MLNISFIYLFMKYVTKIASLKVVLSEEERVVHILFLTGHTLLWYLLHS